MSKYCSPHQGPRAHGASHSHGHAVDCGPLQELLDDPTVEEIVVQSLTDINVLRNGTFEPAPTVRFRSAEQVCAVIDNLLTVR